MAHLKETIVLLPIRDICKRRSIETMNRSPTKERAAIRFAWHLMQALSKVDNWQARNAFFEQVKREVRRSFPQMPQYGAVKSAGHEAGGEYCSSSGNLSR
jgi:hypothetical protein